MMTPVAGPQTQKFAFGQPTVPNLNIRLVCPNCKEDPPNLVEEYSKGDIVCTSCGTILGDRIVDTRSEWRTFAGDENGDDPSRVGDTGNILLGEDLTTRISMSKNAASTSFQRAASRQNNADKTNKNLVAAFARINEIGEKMQLSRNVINQAQWAFKIAEESNILRSKETDPIVAASIILGCRNARVDRSLIEVAKITGVDKKKIGQMLLKLNPYIKKSLGKQSSTAVVSNGEQSIKNLLGRYTNFLGLDMDIVKASSYIAEKAAHQEGVVGRSPVSIAAGVLYFAIILYDRADDLEKASANAISNIAEVSAGTIKHVCKLIAMKITAVTKPEWTSLSGYDRLYALGNPEPVKASRAGTPKLEAVTPKSEVVSPKDEPSPIQVKTPEA